MRLSSLMVPREMKTGLLNRQGRWILSVTADYGKRATRVVAGRIEFMCGRTQPAWFHFWIVKPERLLCHILLSASLCMVGCTVSSPQPNPVTYPVRCTAEVNWPKGMSLEQLKDLPVEELHHPEIGIDGVVLMKGDETNSVRVRTWREFDYYYCAQEGYMPCDMTDLRMLQLFIQRRGFVPFLEQAQPSKASYVHDLPMDRRLLNILPIELGPLASDEEEKLAQKATAEGKTWLEFYPKTRIRKRTKTMLHLQASGFDVWLRVMAYGDYNGDGVEDLLLCVRHHATRGTVGYSFLAVLTRQGTDQVLRKIATPQLP